MGGMKRIWLAAGVCAVGLGLAAGLSAVAAQGGASSPDHSAPHAEAPPANRPPTVGVRGGSVRAGEGLTLAAYATDMESAAVHLEVSLDVHPGAAVPAWLSPAVWTAGLSAQPILRIPLSPPADAAPGAYEFLAGATDGGGLTTWRRLRLEVLPPARPAAPSGASPNPAGGSSVGAAAPSAGALPVAAPQPAPAARPSSSSPESPGLSLSVSPASVSEGSVRDVVVSATLTGVAMVPGMDVVGVLQVSGTATDGTDYTLGGTRSFRIPAGSATLTGTRTLRLAALADELRAEGDETVRLKVAQVTRGTEVLALSKSAKATVTITDVYAKPPAPSGVAASAGPAKTGGGCGSSSCSLEISWEAPEASPAVTEYVVKARRRGASDDAGKVTVSGGTLKATFPGLKAGERYDVRVRARNRVGGGDWAEGAWGDTAPLVKLAAKKSVRVIGEDGGELAAKLTASANVQVKSESLQGASALEGRWYSVSPTDARTALGDVFKLVAKKDAPHTDRSASPAVRTYLFRATHILGSGSSERRTAAERRVTVTWLPKVVLDASPSLVAEDGGARTVTVTASLTGAAQDASSKSVTVKVKGGTAREGRDFASVGNFTMSIPGGAGSASGTFTLTPVADTEAEGGETVKVKGSAMQGTQPLEVKGSQVVVQDERATLTVSPPPSNGSVSGTGIACGTGTSGDCSERVLKGASAALTASPASGYVFKDWSGACASEKGASCTVAVSGATTVGASFRRPKVKVRVSPASGGSVTGSGIDCGSGTTGDCSEKVSGGSMALTATPASGYAVSAWSGGGCSGTGTTCTASVTADATVTVTFARETRPTLTISPAPANGSVAGTGIACGSGTTGDCAETVNAGTKITLTASPSANYAVESWSGGGCTGTGTTCEVTVNAATTVAVTFAKPTLTISPTPVNGSVTGTGIACGAGTSGDCSETVNKGAKVTLTASPATNYAVGSWSGGGCSGTGTSCEVTVNADATVSVTFAKPTLTISPAPASGHWFGGGDGDRLRSGHFGGLRRDGEQRHVRRADGDAGGELLRQGVDGDGHRLRRGLRGTQRDGEQGRGTGTTCTVRVDSDTTVSVAFAKPTLTISPTPTNGSVSGTGIACGTGTSGDCEEAVKEAVNAGTSVTLTATPSANYSVKEWSGGGCAGTGTTCEVEVNADTTVSVTFSKPTLTISPAPTNGSVSGTGIACGTGTSGDCEEAVNAGTRITLTATPAANYAVGSWSGGGCAGTGTTCEVTVNAATTVSVTFAKPTLTISPTPVNGSVAGTGIACGSGTSGDCEETVNSGASVVLTATPASNYSVKEWSGGGCTGTGTTCTVRVDSDTTVSVAFAKPTLTISPTPTNGSVSGTGVACGTGTSGDCEEAVNAGTRITLTATPSANYAVGSWSGGGCTGTGTTCEVTVNAATTVAVTFAKPTLTISPTPTNGSVTGTGVACGSGTSGDCSETVNAGTKITLTASPAANYAVGSWSGGCTGTGTTCEVTVNAATTVSVAFAKPTLTISPTPTSGSVSGTGIACGAGTSGDCSEAVNAGTKITLTASPAANYAVGSWSGGGCTGTGTTCEVTVNSDTTVAVAFAKPTLTISPTPTNGSVAGTGIACGAGTTGDCSEAVNKGAKVTLTASPATNYAVKSWSGGGCSGTGTSCEVTVNSDTTVAVTFAKPTLTVSPKPTNGYVTGNGLSCGSGSGRTTCSVTLNGGARISLTATADSGYDFSRWSGGCSGTSSSCAFTLTADATVGAAFVVEPTYALEAVYFLSSTKPVKPTGGTHRYLHTPPGGWTRTQPAPTLSKQVYRSQRTATYVNGGFRSATAWSDVEKYKHLSQRTEYVYKLSATKPLAPPGGTTTANHTPSGWKKSPDQPTLTQPVWRADRTVTLEHTLRLGGFYSERFNGATNWRNVVKYSWKEEDFVYKRATNKPPAPTGGARTVNHTPPGWQRTIPLPTLTQPVWRAGRVETHIEFAFDSATAWGGVVKYSWKEEDFVYKRATNKPPAPTGGARTVNHTPPGWQRTIPLPTLTQPVWRAERVETHTEFVFDSATAWGGVKKWLSAKLDGYIYRLAASKPSAPSGGANIERHTPSGWQRRSSPPAGTATHNAYRAERILYYDKDDSFEDAGSWGGVTQVGSALSVDPGGPYTATYYAGVSSSIISIPPLWHVTVTASASGGAGSYTFRWQGKTTDGSSARYVFTESGTHTRSVTVTDANRSTKTSNPPASITCSVPGAGGSSDGGAVRIPVPLGGTLVIVWGNGGLASASSKDAGVAAASASGDEITVTGVAAGETDIVAQANGVEYWVPVRVGG